MITVATTTISVLRVPSDPTRDPLDPQPPAAVVSSGVRAHISTSRGSERVSSGGQQEVVYFRLLCDPTDIQHGDQVRDDATGELYEVEWARPRVGLGLDHTQAGLKQVDGVTASIGGAR